MRDGKELKPCLSGRGVTKVFGFGDAKTVAVDHVDFDFHEGEFVSIVGESGSGKSGKPSYASETSGDSGAESM